MPLKLKSGQYKSNSSTTFPVRPMCGWRYKLAIFLVIAALGIANIDAAGDTPLLQDAHSGPRCIQRILEYYGKNAELIDLVREINWPVSSSGATLDQLQTSLRARGIEARALDIPKDTDFHWPHPAIFPLIIDNTPHYVVWLPPKSKDGNAIIWGASYWRRISSDDFLSSQTGIVLLTSTSPILAKPNLSAVNVDQDPLLWVVALAVGSFVAAAYWTRASRQKSFAKMRR